MQVYENLTRCKVCGSEDLQDVIQLGPQYLSPTFVKDNATEELAKVQVPLTLTLCRDCSLLQLREEVAADLLYKRYFYRSATNDQMRADLKDVIEDIRSRVDLQDGDLVVDIGANDGTTISFWPPNLTRIGVEPAQNIDWSGLDPSIHILNDYFTAEVIERAFPGKQVKALSCNAMFYDLPDPNSIVAGVKRILAPDGLWSIQLSYLPLMFDNFNFYDICHEHLSYYSLKVLNHLMNRNGLKVVDAKTNGVNGGSVRVFITHLDSATHDTEQGQRNIDTLLAREREMQLDQPAIYEAFYQRMQDASRKVVGYMTAEREKGHAVLGLGASTKGNVLLQFFGIDRDLMPYISERNEAKVGLRTLGTDFELISEEKARDLKPSVMLVLPWYFKDEIVKREQGYIQSGGNLLFPMPEPHLVTRDGEVVL